MGKSVNTATVYIGSTTGGNSGHASLEVGDVYISYWPTGEDSEVKDNIKNPPAKGNLKDFKVGSTHKVTFPSSYKVDRRLERKEADYVLTVDGLDMSLINQHWLEFKNNPKRYNMKSSNCSTIVTSFLELGAGVPYKKTPCIKINSYVLDPMARFFISYALWGTQ